MKRIFIACVRFYQTKISPHKKPCCRFYPTCSQYAIEAFEEWGAVIGLGLSIWRILRCNPFSKGGHDPVPKRKRRADSTKEKGSKEKTDS